MLPDLSRQKTTPVVGRATVFAVSVMLNTSLVSTQRICTLPFGAAPGAAAPGEREPHPDHVVRRVVHGRDVRDGSAERGQPYGAADRCPHDFEMDRRAARTWNTAARHVVSSVGTS